VNVRRVGKKKADPGQFIQNMLKNGGSGRGRKGQSGKPKRANKHLNKCGSRFPKWTGPPKPERKGEKKK